MPRLEAVSRIHRSWDSNVYFPQALICKHLIWRKKVLNINQSKLNFGEISEQILNAKRKNERKINKYLLKIPPGLKQEMLNIIDLGFIKEHRGVLQRRHKGTVNKATIANSVDKSKKNAPETEAEISKFTNEKMQNLVEKKCEGTPLIILVNQKSDTEQNKFHKRFFYESILGDNYKNFKEGAIEKNHKSLQDISIIGNRDNRANFVEGAEMGIKINNNINNPLESIWVNRPFNYKCILGDTSIAGSQGDFVKSNGTPENHHCNKLLYYRSILGIGNTSKDYFDKSVKSNATRKNNLFITTEKDNKLFNYQSDMNYRVIADKIFLNMNLDVIKKINKVYEEANQKLLCCKDRAKDLIVNDIRLNVGTKSENQKNKDLMDAAKMEEDGILNMKNEFELSNTAVNSCKLSPNQTIEEESYKDTKYDGVRQCCVNSNNQADSKSGNEATPGGKCTDRNVVPALLSFTMEFSKRTNDLPLNQKFSDNSYITSEINTNSEFKVKNKHPYEQDKIRKQINSKLNQKIHSKDLFFSKFVSKNFPLEIDRFKDKKPNVSKPIILKLKKLSESGNNIESKEEYLENKSQGYFDKCLNERQFNDNDELNPVAVGFDNVCNSLNMKNCDQLQKNIITVTALESQNPKQNMDNSTIHGQEECVSKELALNSDDHVISNKALKLQTSGQHLKETCSIKCKKIVQKEITTSKPVINVQMPCEEENSNAKLVLNNSHCQALNNTCEQTQLNFTKIKPVHREKISANANPIIMDGNHVACKIDTSNGNMNKTINSSTTGNGNSKDNQEIVSVPKLESQDDRKQCYSATMLSLTEQLNAKVKHENNSVTKSENCESIIEHYGLTNFSNSCKLNKNDLLETKGHILPECKQTSKKGTNMSQILTETRKPMDSNINRRISSVKKSLEQNYEILNFEVTNEIPSGGFSCRDNIIRLLLNGRSDIIDKSPALTRLPLMKLNQTKQNSINKPPIKSSYCGNTSTPFIQSKTLKTGVPSRKIDNSKQKFAQIVQISGSSSSLPLQNNLKQNISSKSKKQIPSNQLQTKLISTMPDMKPSGEKKNKLIQILPNFSYKKKRTSKKTLISPSPSNLVSKLSNPNSNAKLFTTVLTNLVGKKLERNKVAKNVECASYQSLTNSPSRCSSKLANFCRTLKQIDPIKMYAKEEKKEMKTDLCNNVENSTIKSSVGKDSGKGGLSTSLVHTDEKKQPIFVCPKSQSEPVNYYKNFNIYDVIKENLLRLETFIKKKTVYKKDRMEEKFTHLKSTQRFSIHKRKTVLKSLQEKKADPKRSGRRVNHIKCCTPSYSDFLNKASKATEYT